MMEWLVAALGTGTLCYTIVVLWLCVGILRSRRGIQCDSATPSVSVIVAARNEVERIPSCLLALKRQQYPGRLQIVIIDDRSTDGTGALVASMVRDWEDADVVLVRAPDKLRYACPKKSALAAGIEVSDGDLLLFTDADCEPPPEWVARMVARFADDVGLVAGFACAEPLRQIRHRLLAVDNLGVSALAEGSIGMGAPLSCTGRSLAYRRSLWNQVGGFEEIGHLISGDDVYFLRLVAGTDWRVVYCAEAEAVVTGPPGPSALTAILNQKVRHASKAARYGGGARWLSVAIYGYHALLLAGLMQIVSDGPWQVAWMAWMAWLCRWGVDAALLSSFAPRQRRDRVLLTFLPVVEALYIPYVLILVPLGRLGRFRWKEDETPSETVAIRSHPDEIC